MFEFVQPLWMLAASGIIIPVLIHLWNVREGKTLKIGSVSLLVQSSRQAARSFRFRDILLLILRCLLILLLAALLAGPVWMQARKPERQKGWVLLEKHSVQEAYAKFRPQIDSLTKAGFQLHYFEQGFPQTNTESISTLKDSARQAATSYWSLLQILQPQVQANLPVYLYTGNHLNRFTGTRPELTMDLHWQTYTPSDSVSSWISAARLTSSDSIGITKATSHPAVLEYATTYIPATKAAQSGYNLNFENGKLLISSSDSIQSNPVEVDTATLRIVIYADSYATDAAYLQAAIRAIRQYSNRRIQLHLINNTSDMALKPDWLFWLSDKALPQNITASNIFRYTGGQPQQLHSWMVQREVESSAEPVAIYKAVSGSTNNAGLDVVWEDGFGHPLLTKQMQDQTAVFSFNSRFNPQWNDLPWSSRFPVWMLQLLLPGQKDDAITYNDKRKIDEQQLSMPVIPADKNVVAEALVEKNDLSKALWIVAFIILLVERIITYWNKNLKPA